MSLNRVKAKSTVGNVVINSSPGLTNAELRATAVPVSHGGLTNAELRATAVPVSHGGLTNAEIRATPLNVVPCMNSGGHISQNTHATVGTTYVAFGNNACKQLTIFNNTGVAIEVQQGGAGVGVPIQDKTFFTFFGLTNSNQLAVRRIDLTAGALTVQARFEN